MAHILWTQQQPIGPDPRMRHGMAYDAVRKVAVLFGGRSHTGEFGDTWAWDGNLWTQLSDIGPAARAAHTMAFDEARMQVVLFGGVSGNNAFGDTWIWDGMLWTQISDVGPSARSGHAMAYDRTRRRTVLFGGRARVDAVLGETWEWDGEDWTQLEDAGPGPRSEHCMAYDSTRGAVVLFGGTTEANPLADTWEWNGTAWTEVAHFGPPARLSAALAFNGSRVTLFGGARSTSVMGDTWEWDGHHWTQQQHFGPAPRLGHGIVLDSNQRRIVLFGGSVATELSDNTPLRGDTWQHTPIVSAPPATLASIEVEPAAVTSGRPFTVRVTLSSAATEAVTVALAAEPPLPSLPAELVVAAGSTTATSNPIPTPSDGSGTFQVTGRLGAVSRTATLVVTVAPTAVLAFLALLPNVRDVNETFTMIVGLSGEATEPTIVSMSSAPAIAGLPTSITIESGTSSTQIQASSTASGSFVVTASLGAQRQSANLMITPIGAGTDLVSLQVFPERLPPNAQFTVVASIKNPAGNTPVSIALSASPGIGSLPSSAVVQPGSDFTIVSDLAAPPPGEYTIRGVGGAITLEARLTVV